MNAIVGDNGIITQAQNANIQSGMSALEEYLQGKYVENYESYSGMDSKVVCLRNLHPEYFYSPHNDDNIGNKNYIVYTTTAEDGSTVSYQLYLIKKSGLPNEIKSQLVSGEAESGGYANYASLKDVYGVTSNLKVFYCADGWDSMTELSSKEFDLDSQDRIIYSPSSTGTSAGMYNLITKTLGTDTNSDITLGDLNSIKALTIDSSVTSLNEIYNLTNLETLTLENAKLDSLNGIENATKIYRINIYGSNITNYTAMSKLGNKLNYLVVYNTTDNELEKMCRDLANAEFSKLQYLAITGTKEYLWQSGGNSSAGKSSNTITSTTPLSYLSEATKQAVKYLSISCNNIKKLDGLRDYKNVVILRANYNKIESLDGIENMKNTLVSLMVTGNSLGINESKTEKNSETDALAVLNEFSNLKLLWLNSNSIVWIDYINLTGGTFSTLYLAGNSLFNVGSITSIVDTYWAASTTNIDSIWLKYLNSNEILNYANQSLTDSSPEIQYLSSMSSTNKLKVKTISLSGNPNLSNDKIASILLGYNNLIALDLTDLINLNTISFVSNIKKLEQCWISGTKVVDVSLLNNLTNLKSIKISNTAIDLTTIPNAISRCSKNVWGYSSKYYTTTNNIGLNIVNAELVSKLSSCKNLSYLNFRNCTLPSTLDLSGLNSSCNLIFFGTSAVFTLPSKIDNISFFGGIGGISNQILNITNLVSDSSASLNYFYYMFGNGKNTTVTNVNLTNHGGNITNNLILLKNAKGLKSLYIGSCGHQNGKIYIDDFTNVISDFDELTSFSLNYCDINTLKGVENMRELTNLSITESSIYDLTPLKDLTNLTSLILNDNCISKLAGIENLTNLTIINLNNNSLVDTYEVVESNGKKTVINNLQILADLHTSNTGSLSKVYLYGNTSIMNYSLIANLNWTEKSGF